LHLALEKGELGKITKFSRDVRGGGHNVDALASRRGVRRRESMLRLVVKVKLAVTIVIVMVMMVMHLR
jgi:hypothetical protein